jgi:hypothetical protein
LAGPAGWATIEPLADIANGKEVPEEAVRDIGLWTA